jgi:hypothetical protein
MKKSNAAAMLGVMLAMANMGAPMAAPAAPTTQQQSQQQSSERREQAPMRISAPQVMVQYRNMFGGFGNASHKASRHLNQRQYRKLVRQNPHLRKSKKYRGKN